MDMIEFLKLGILSKKGIKKATTISNLLLEHKIPFSYTDGGVSVDNIVGRNFSQMNDRLERLKILISKKLPKDIEIIGDFEEHSIIKIGIEKENHIPFTLLFDDGQVLTVLINNVSDNKKHSQYKRNEMQVTDLWFINEANITDELNKKNIVELSDMSNVISKAISGNHKMFVAKNPNANKSVEDLEKELGNIEIDLSNVVEVVNEDIPKKEEPKEEPEDKPKLEEKISFLKKYMTEDELNRYVNNIDGEEGQFFKDKINKIYKTIKTMPKTYEAREKENDAIVYLHYFKDNSDWYIIENDKQMPPKQAFGYTILNGDKENAELGYINISELIRVGVELDLHWSEKSLREVKNKEGIIEKPKEVQDEELNNILEEVSEIVNKDEDITLKDLEYFTDEVITLLDNAIKNGNKKAIEYEKKLITINEKLQQATLDNIEEPSLLKTEHKED